MAHRAHVVIFGVATAAIAATVYAVSAGTLGDTPSAPKRTDLASERGSARRADSTAPALARSSSDLHRGLERIAEPARDQAADPARAESEDPSAADRQASVQAARCDDVIAHEKVDPEWRSAELDHFNTFFARPAFSGTKVRAMDCRSTMCRIELAHHSNDDRDRFIQSFSDLAGPKGMVFAHIETADDLDVVVYVTRDGVAIPLHPAGARPVAGDPRVSFLGSGAFLQRRNQDW